MFQLTERKLSMGIDSDDDDDDDDNSAPLPVSEDDATGNFFCFFKIPKSEQIGFADVLMAMEF